MDPNLFLNFKQTDTSLIWSNTKKRAIHESNPGMKPLAKDLSKTLNMGFDTTCWEEKHRRIHQKAQ